MAKKESSTIGFSKYPGTCDNNIPVQIREGMELMELFPCKPHEPKGQIGAFCAIADNVVIIKIVYISPCRELERCITVANSSLLSSNQR